MALINGDDSRHPTLSELRRNVIAAAFLIISISAGAAAFVFVMEYVSDHFLH